MDLAKKFEKAASCKMININSLGKEKQYAVVRTKRITSKYRPTVLLTVRDSESCVLQIFLPKSYCAVISDDDMDEINNSAVSLNLVYKDICKTPKSYLLAIKSFACNPKTLIISTLILTQFYTFLPILFLSFIISSCS